MTSGKWTVNTGEQQDLRYPAARFNEKGCWPVWEWRCFKNISTEGQHVTLPKYFSHPSFSYSTLAQA
jgi:hypothetical protein